MSKQIQNILNKCKLLMEGITSIPSCTWGMVLNCLGYVRCGQ